MKDFYYKYCESNLWFHILVAFSACMIVASFICPPLGVIDSSVLAAIGELGGLGALGTVLYAIRKGTPTRVSTGKTEIEVGSNDKKEQ